MKRKLIEINPFKVEIRGNNHIIDLLISTDNNYVNLQVYADRNGNIFKVINCEIVKTNNLNP